MSDPDPNVDALARLHRVEHALDTTTDRLDSLTVTLEKILKQIPGIESNSDPTDPVPPRAIPEAPPAAPHRHRLKPATPSEFNGDRAKGRAFFNSCILYMSLCPDEFEDLTARVHWILSYMKGDRAATWADRAIRYEKANPKGGTHFRDWDTFEAEFKATFFPENEATDALMKLESEQYFQRKRTVDTYVDEFEDLIALSGYSDNLAIVIKFRRGLNPTIQDKIAEMGRDRPDDRNPLGWYAAARRFDQNRRANEAFNSSSVRKPPPPSASSTFALPRPTPPIARNTWQRPTVATSTAPTAPQPPLRSFGRPLPQGVPMDIDAAKRRGNLPSSCYRCGEPGHVSRDCPQPFDIRAMSADDREDLIQSLLALKDETADTAGVREEEESEEGFPHRSG